MFINELEKLDLIPLISQVNYDVKSTLENLTLIRKWAIFSQLEAL